MIATSYKPTSCQKVNPALGIIPSVCNLDRGILGRIMYEK